MCLEGRWDWLGPTGLPRAMPGLGQWLGCVCLGWGAVSWAPRLLMSSPNSQQAAKRVHRHTHLPLLTPFHQDCLSTTVPSAEEPPRGSSFAKGVGIRVCIGGRGQDCEFEAQTMPVEGFTPRWDAGKDAQRTPCLSLHCAAWGVLLTSAPRG